MTYINHVNDKCILILAAASKAYNEYFQLPEVLLNIGTTLAIEKTLTILDPDKITKVYIAVDGSIEKIKSIVPLERVEAIDVGKTSGVLETVKISLEKINESLIHIIPITTIPVERLNFSKLIYFSNSKIPKENWSSLVLKDYSELIFYSKNDQSSYGINSYPFTGRITAERNDILKIINSASELEFTDLLFLARKLLVSKDYNICHSKWLDIGHSATYSETKLSTISSRFFNNLEYNKKEDSLIKHSTDCFKLENEYKYYKSLPRHLARYFPHILEFDSEKNKPFSKLEMEYLPFPSLSELFLFWSLGQNSWIRIIKSIDRVYSEFYEQKKSSQIASVTWLYTEKISNRFEEIKLISEGANHWLLYEVLNKGIVLNGQIKCPSLNSTILDILPYLIQFEHSRPLYFGHGDLCFNNIILDPSSGSLKLIDPKAFYEQSSKKIGLIDPAYDLAKLNHSFFGLYDCIVNNMYSLKKRPDGIDLSIFIPSNYNFILETFRKIILADRIDIDMIRIITASLFLSMLPLHKEDLDRTSVLAIVGIAIFYDLDLESLHLSI